MNSFRLRLVEFITFAELIKLIPNLEYYIISLPKTNHYHYCGESWIIVDEFLYSLHINLIYNTR
jgi:hypothetical protein